MTGETGEPEPDGPGVPDGPGEAGEASAGAHGAGEGAPAGEGALAGEGAPAGVGALAGEATRAGEVLGELAGLRRRARSDRHAYWFPLVLFGVLSCAATPFYRSAFLMVGGVARSAGVTEVALSPGIGMPLLGQAPFGGTFFLGYYWLLALVGGYLVSALWYRRHARRAGLQTPARGYVVTGIAATVAALLLPPLSQFRPLAWLSVLWPGELVVRGTFPYLIIAAGLWVLARAERSRGLAATALVYSVAALVSSLYNTENLLFRLGWTPSANDLWQTALPNLLLPAAVLLAAGAIAGAAAAAGRRKRALA
jgi:hypothetical protein